MKARGHSGGLRGSRETDMNHWIVIFKDEPGMAEHRKAHFPDHLAYLTSQKEIFLDGGSLAEKEGEALTGGIWIVRATARDEIVRLIEGDPLYHQKLRSYQIFATGKQFSVIEPG